MANDKPRYSRVSDIIELATFMASKPFGITINDIIERYSVSRRTAERMRDSLLSIFSSIDEIETNDSLKHWGFSDYYAKGLVHIEPKDIANLEQVQNFVTNSETKKGISILLEKIKTISAKNLGKFENDISLIMQTEGYALRQTQQYKIDDNILAMIREALQKSLMMTGIYHNKERLIEPLGMIYGEKIYLLAREKAKGEDIYTFLPHKFKNLKLSNKTFDKGDFDLRNYSKQTFGVYFGKPLDVKLQFDKEIAEDVLNYSFHPSQKISQQDDGSVIVRFKASGDLEIMWNIFRWGNKVKILSPKSLKKEYLENLKSIYTKNS